jgi:isoleucyl-tRNA synthetase
MTKDYKATIFLPQTDFPMKGDLAQKEPEILQRWKDIDLYGLTQKAAEGRDLFIVHDGPPYANGQIHLGHALNHILKDIINKSQFKLGKLTPFVPGWDCHGLPIEAKIEEKYREKGVKKEDVPRLQFRNDCKAFAEHWIAIQIEEFKRLGMLAEWDNPYTTMSPAAEAEIIRLLGIFLMNKGLYRGIKPVMWSVVEKTALAEAEVEYYDHESLSIYVQFPIHTSPLPILKGANALIWTTTPWTLPGNRAIAYGADLEYVVVRVDETAKESQAKVGTTLLLAKDLQKSVESVLNITGSTVLATFSGAELKGTLAHHPFYGEGYDFDVPLLPGEHVTLEAGTGLVHTAPGHGVEDFAVGKAFGLDVPETVDEGGLFYEHVPLFAGKHVYKVGPDIAQKLNERGALLYQGKIVHSYPHSWRSKKPLIYRTTPQWFISLEVNGLRQKALEAIDKVTWVPKNSRNRIRSMIENRPDWCLSRQREWGTPMTLFVNKKTGDVLRDHKVMERIVQAVKEEGSNVWYTADPVRFLGPDYAPDEYEQVQDILDVWFDAGCTQSFVLRNRPNLKWPADLYVEGSDQHRGWFQSSLLVSCGTHNEAPYKQVITHGFIVDEDGRKMSKSRGDAVSPQTVTSTMGADILRLWVVGSDIYEDLKVGPEILKRQQDIYRRYRNTFRYLLGALSGFFEEEKLNYESMPDLEKWVLHRLYELDQKVRETTTSYDFKALYTELHTFCAVDLSAFYFDIRKDSLYCDDPMDTKRRASRTVMDVVFECLTKWLAPVLCFTAEEAWLTRYPSEKESVHLELFPRLPYLWNDPEVEKRIEGLRNIRKVMTGAIEVARNSKLIGSSLQAHLTLFLDPSLTPFIKDVDLAELSITSAVEFKEEVAPTGAFTLEDIPGVAVTVSLATGEKCARCWKTLPSVKGLCYRCADVVGSHGS